MKTTRKQYDEIAKQAQHTYRLFDKHYEPKSTFSLFLADLADTLTETNAAFKRDKFFLACGMPAEDRERLL